MRRAFVSTISIQKWILKVLRQAHHCDPDRCFNNIDPEVDTESCRKLGRRSVCLGFNNIDPEVDTESDGVLTRDQKEALFQQYRSRSGY